MTNYVFPGNMLENCTDADLDTIYPSHISVGVGSTPVLIDWSTAPGGANPYIVISPAWAGHVKLYKTGVRVYDDEGTPALNPSSSHIAPPLKLQFKVMDVRGGESPEVAQDTLYLQGLAADPVPPAVIDMVPSVGATGIALDGLIQITWSKVLLAGAAGIAIRNVTDNTLIETITLPGALDINYPPAPGKIFMNGDMTVIKPSSDLPTGKTIAVRPAFDFVTNLTGTANVAITADTLAFATVTPAPTGSLWGYTPGVDYGTSGAMFVDQAAGNDANAGTTVGSPKKTISSAMAAMANNVGGKIKVKAGTYNETVTMKAGASGNRLVIEPYGTAAPIITCAEPMATGWVLCDASDAPLVGPNYASIYKKAGVAVNTFPQNDPFCANLFAGDIRLNIARKFKYGQNVTCWNRSMDFLTADSVVTHPVVVSGKAYQEIDIYRHAALLAAFTPYQLQKAAMVVQESPNIVNIRRLTISGSDIIPSSSVTQDSSTSVGWHMNFGIFNLIAAMEQGGWGVDWDGSAATCDLYAWLPSGKTPADIKYSARTNAVVGNVSHTELNGLIMEHMSGQQSNFWGTSGSTLARGFSSGFSADSTSVAKQNIRIENCLFRNGWSHCDHVGGVSIYNGTNVVVRKCTFDDLQGTEGCTIVQSANVLVEWCKFDKVFREDFWPRATNKVVYAHNLHVGSMLGHSHNNGVAFYALNEGLEWGNIWKNATFFGTWQDANNIQFCFNVFDWISAYCALKDQSSSVAGFAATIGGMMLHNTLVFSAHRIYPFSQSIDLREGPNHAFKVKGNIYWGSVHSGTVFTANSGNINTRVGSDLPAGTGNQYEHLDTTFRDRVNRDYSIGLSSVIRTTPGASIAADIAALAGAYPFFTDFTDPFGNAINTAAPTIGAMSNPDINPMMAA